MEGASSSFNFNFAERDVQLLNETEFRDSEESEDFSDYDSDASWESFDKQAFNELPELELFVFNQEEYIKAQVELEQKIIVSDENDDYQDDIKDTEIPASPSPSPPSPPLPLLISTDILPSQTPTGVPPPLIPTKTPPLIPIEEQSKPICELKSTTLLSSCVLVDLVDGKLQTCGRTENVKNICQLVGVWQIDTNAAIEFEADRLTLGVCMQHFNYDQKNHSSKAKQMRKIQQSEVRRRRCLFCYKNFYFFGRGVGCKEHSWNVFGKNIQIPCIGLFTCNSLHECQEIAKRNFDEVGITRYICCECYESKGGHLHHQPGPGKRTVTCIEKNWHINDSTKSLELLAQWLHHVAQTESEDQKKKILACMLVPAINFLYTPSEIFPLKYIYCNPKDDDYYNNNDVSESMIPNPTKTIPFLFQIPSFFFLEMLMHLNQVKKFIKSELELEWDDVKWKEIGIKLASKVWNS